MAKKPPIRVALDLETTGLHAEQDAILEVAAIKFQGNEVLDTFETFVAPGRSIPYRVQRLTGIKPELITGAPHFDTIAKQLQGFLGDFPIVGHSIPFDVGFLRRRGLARTNALVDTFELATVMLPSLASYNLGQVAEALGIIVPQDRHRAMVDTVLAKDVFLVLQQRLQGVDITLLKDLANLDAPRTWPLLHFFRQELRERQEQDGVQGTLARGSLGDRFAAQLGMDPRVLSFAIAQQSQPVQVAPPPIPPEAPVIQELQQIQSQIEVIPEQEKPQGQETQAAPVVPSGYQTARNAIHKALENCTPLLVEVTIGGSDYTPALLPALEWLTTSSEDEAPPKRLVITCATQQSARRLTELVLPRLQAMLKSQVSVAYLAERGGYLCMHRWFGAAMRRTSGELSSEQARGMAKLALWAQQTTTGERSELTLFPPEMAAWGRINSGVERVASTNPRTDSMYQRCTYRQKGYCFVSNAEERVNAATIVVTTHSGLFDDLSRPPQQSLLASIKHRVMLDMDLLEEENARWNSTELDQNRLLTLLNTIGAEMPDGRYQGLLALAAPSLHESGPGGLSRTPTVAKSDLDTRMLSWFQSLRQARSAIDKLFVAFSHLLEEFMQQGANGNGRDKGRNDSSGRAHGGRAVERTDQPLRLSGQIRSLGAWMETEKAWQQAAYRLQTVIDLTREAEKIILTAQRNRHRTDIGSGEDSSLASELIAVALQLQEQKQLGQQALLLANGDTVYWLRTPVNPALQQQRSTDGVVASAPVETMPVLYAQLVQTSTILKQLLNKDHCAILVGTSLSVDNSFSYYRGRFGLDSDTCPAFSVVTEHDEQTLLYLPNDVPEPNMPQYQRHLDESLVQLATALEGQLVALFTSHAALRSSYASIKAVLESRGILVLGQGVDGSPRQLWQVFQSQERVVLLGTGSFWDGIEDATRTPTCIFVARLPMPVLNDPPIAARAEQYSDQLHQLTVPVASLRMRRSLNRLAWSDNKRNAIVLFDRRVISKEYGTMVLNSLPHCSQRQGPASHMPETLLDWLTGKGAWQ